MASFRPVGWAGKILTYTPDLITQDAQYIHGKMARLLILQSRVKGSIEQVNRSGVASSVFVRNLPMNYKSQGERLDSPELRELKIRSSGYNIPQKNDDLFYANQNHIRYEATRSKSVSEEFGSNTTQLNDVDNEKITLIFLGNGIEKKYESLELPFIPREVQFSPENNLVAIASPGRNTPFYHYTGSEDTLEFTIDWVSLDDSNSKQDVIRNCRHIEAMSKNDGYDNSIATVIINWGSSNSLFKNMKWVIAKAPYKLQNFNKGFKDPVDKVFVGTSLLPVQAYQQITLKRIYDHNAKRNEILHYN